MLKDLIYIGVVCDLVLMAKLKGIVGVLGVQDGIGDDN